MSQVKFAPAAIRDLQRLRDFLRPKNAGAAHRAGDAIRQGGMILSARPRLGRMTEDLPGQFRKWPLDFGDSGHAMRYQIRDDAVTILAIRHQKEVGYHAERHRMGKCAVD